MVSFAKIGLIGTFAPQARSNRAPARDHMHGAPEQAFAVMGGLQAEQPPVPAGIVDEADVFDGEVGLPPSPFRRPGEMRLVELLAEFRNSTT